MEPRILLFNPLDLETAQFTPAVFSRLRRFARDIIRMQDYDGFSRQLISRLVLKDPSLAVAIAVDDDRVISHVVCEMATVDDQRALFISQCQSDIPGVLDKLIEFGDNWGMTKGATIVRTETPGEWPEKVGERVHGKHGFKLVSRVWEREIKHGK